MYLQFAAFVFGTPILSFLLIALFDTIYELNITQSYKLPLFIILGYCLSLLARMLVW